MCHKTFFLIKRFCIKITSFSQQIQYLKTFSSIIKYFFFSKYRNSKANRRYLTFVETMLMLATTQYIIANFAKKLTGTHFSCSGRVPYQSP